MPDTHIKAKGIEYYRLPYRRQHFYWLGDGSSRILAAFCVVDAILQTPEEDLNEWLVEPETKNDLTTLMASFLEFNVYEIWVLIKWKFLQIWRQGRM